MYNQLELSKVETVNGFINVDQAGELVISYFHSIQQGKLMSVGLELFEIQSDFFASIKYLKDNPQLINKFDNNFWAVFLGVFSLASTLMSLYRGNLKQFDLARDCAGWALLFVPENDPNRQTIQNIANGILIKDLNLPNVVNEINNITPSSINGKLNLLIKVIGQ